MIPLLIQWLGPDTVVSTVVSTAAMQRAAQNVLWIAMLPNLYCNEPFSLKRGGCLAYQEML